MKIDWTPVRKALAECRVNGQAVPIWWRDDDAVAETPPLDRLEDMSHELGLPVHLAIIPDRLQRSLPARVLSSQWLCPVVHGWRHDNHAPPSQKKSEFGHARDTAAREIADGLTAMKSSFGPRLLPMFVPPWNQLDPAFHPALAAVGYRAVSTFGPRSTKLAANGLVQINTHLDPVDWHGTRDLKPPETLLRILCDLLERRHTGATDADEPLGYLTHHLVHSPRLWDFSHQLLSELLQGGARPQPIAALLEDPDEQA